MTSTLIGLAQTCSLCWCADVRIPVPTILKHWRTLGAKGLEEHGNFWYNPLYTKHATSSCHLGKCARTSESASGDIPQDPDVTKENQRFRRTLGKSSKNRPREAQNRKKMSKNSKNVVQRTIFWHCLTILNLPRTIFRRFSEGPPKSSILNIFTIFLQFSGDPPEFIKIVFFDDFLWIGGFIECAGVGPMQVGRSPNGIGC